MPQGGIDPGEDIEAAARRELWEETGVVSAEILDRSPEPWRYDFPPYEGPAHRLSVFRGQEQLWVAMRFVGAESEIDVATPRNGAPAEFGAWRWDRIDRVASLVVPFRRAVYEKVARAFARWAHT